MACAGHASQRALPKASLYLPTSQVVQALSKKNLLSTPSGGPNGPVYPGPQMHCNRRELLVVSLAVPSDATTTVEAPNGHVLHGPSPSQSLYVDTLQGTQTEAPSPSYPVSHRQSSTSSLCKSESEWEMHGVHGAEPHESL